MVYKYSTGRILLYFFLSIVLLFGSGFLLAFSFFTYGFVLLVLGVLCISNIWRLFKQNNRNLTLFFDAVKSNDSTVVFPTSTKNHTLDMLHSSLNDLNLHIQKIRLEAEVREKYYRTIIRQSATGFVVMTKDHKIELINEAACGLAGINADSSNLNLLKIRNQRLFEALCDLNAGEAVTIKNYNKFTAQQLLLKANEIKTDSRELMLYSIHDINPELNQKEIESYQKLISILTHEIMNSVAPLTSVAKTLNKLFQDADKGNTEVKFGREELKPVVQGLKVIEEQSEGILSFVGNYRKLIKVPPPEINDIDVDEWCQQLYVLYNEICLDKAIRFDVRIENNAVRLSGDKNLLNQVLVNLINNAMEALEEVEAGKIQVLFSKDKDSFYIHVGNNGPAIPSELQEKIFVPFYTTKHNGSGIGLSLSSQIVKLHKGTLNVFSDVDAGTIFTVKL